MSKESNKQKKGKPNLMPGGIRDLVESVFNSEPTAVNNEIVPKTHENIAGTNTSEPLINSDGLVDFRSYLEEYKNTDPYERSTVYIHTELRDVLDKLKASREFKKYSLKDILNSIIHAYIVEHRDDVVKILSSNRNDILY